MLTKIQLQNLYQTSANIVILQIWSKLNKRITSRVLWNVRAHVFLCVLAHACYTRSPLPVLMLFLFIQAVYSESLTIANIFKSCFPIGGNYQNNVFALHLKLAMACFPFVGSSAFMNGNTHYFACKLATVILSSGNKHPLLEWTHFVQNYIQIRTIFRHSSVERLAC